MSTNDVTVVLAHGAWADGSSWAKVIEGLKAQGIPSIAAALPLTTRPDDLERPRWKDLPSWFLVAEDDHMILEETQRFLADRMKATIRAHKVDHTPSVTAPRPVVDIIMEAVQTIHG